MRANGGNSKWLRGTATVSCLLSLLVLAQTGGFSGCGKKNPATGGPAPVETPETPPEDAPPVRAASVEPLTEPGTLALTDISPDDMAADAMEVVADGLAAADPGDRYLAVDALGVLPWSQAKPLLLKAINDPEPQVAMVALQYLSRRSDPSTQSALLPFLDWDDLWRQVPGKHFAAVRTRDDFDIDYSPIEALARLKDPAVVPYIKAMLESGDVGRLSQGIRLADRYGADAFQVELAKIWSSTTFSDSARYLAIKALSNANFNTEQNERLMRQAITGTEYVPAIIATGYAKEFKKTEWEDDLRQLAKSQDVGLRAAALEALGILGLPIDPAQLNGVLVDVNGRLRLIPDLPKWGGQPAISTLATMANQKGEDHIYILFTLARMGWPQALNELNTLSKQRDPDGNFDQSATAAFNALAEVDDPAVATLLLDGLNNEPGNVKRVYAAIQGLGRLQPEVALPALVRYYRNYRDAHPGLAAYAAAVAAAIVAGDPDPTLPPKVRRIWPIPPVGRYAVVYGKTPDTGAPGAANAFPVPHATGDNLEPGGAE